MFGFFKMYNRNRKPESRVLPVAAKPATTTKETTMKAFIENVDNRVGLFRADGNMIGTYARKRDAVRGATRRGLTLIEA